KALRAALNFFDYLVERALRSFPVKSPEGKKNAVNYLLPYVQRLPNRIERESLAGDIAQKLGIDSGVLRMEFRAAAVRRSTPSSTSSLGAHASLDAQITPAEKILIRAVSSPEGALRRQALDALSEQRLHVGLSVESLLETILSAGMAGTIPSADPMSL